MKKLKPPTLFEVEQKEITMQCPICGGTFSYNDDDILEFNTVSCPWCKTHIDTQRNNSPIFPENFSYFGNESTKYLSDKETQEFVKEILASEKGLGYGEFECVGTGDTLVIGLKYSDEYDVIVAKKYYQYTKHYE